jgi:hypothetical protein
MDMKFDINGSDEFLPVHKASRYDCNLNDVPVFLTFRFDQKMDIYPLPRLKDDLELLSKHVVEGLLRLYLEGTLVEFHPDRVGSGIGEDNTLFGGLGVQ